MLRLDTLVKAIHAAANSAGDILSEKQLDVLDRYFEPSQDGEGRLVPKMAILNYPHPTANGIENHPIEVPLITLVPISSIHVSEMRLQSDLEMVLDGENVMVSFANKSGQRESRRRKRGLFDSVPQKREGTICKLDITIKPQDNPEGLQKLVEGYAKILRAQIPS